MLGWSLVVLWMRSQVDEGQVVSEDIQSIHNVVPQGKVVGFFKSPLHEEHVVKSEIKSVLSYFCFLCVSLSLFIPTGSIS